jgi:integrase
VGPVYEASGAVFSDEIGRRYKPMQASDAYRTIATKAGVPTGLHTLRHSAVTLLLTSGTDVRTVAGIAGHSTPTMTLSVYGHLVETAARAGTDRLGLALEILARG